MPSAKRFSLLLFGSRKEDVIASYVIREHRRGRDLNEILQDGRVTSWLSKEQIERLLDRPEIVRAVGDDMIALHRSSTPSDTPEPDQAT